MAGKMPEEFRGGYNEWVALLKEFHPENGRIESVTLTSYPPIPMAHAYVGPHCVSTWVGKAPPISGGW